MNRLLPFLLLLCALSVRGAEALHCQQTNVNDYYASPPKSERLRFPVPCNVTKIVAPVSTGGIEASVQYHLYTGKDGTGTLLGSSRSVTTNITDGEVVWVEFICGRGGIPVTNDCWLYRSDGLRWLSSSTENYEGTDYFLTYGGSDQTDKDYAFMVYTNTYALRSSTNTLTALDYATVQAGIDDMMAGEVLVLPAGRTNWPTTVNWHNKPLTIYGAGIASTVITNSQTNATSSGEYPALSIQASTNGLCTLDGMSFSTADTNCMIELIPVAGHKYPAARITRCGFERGHYGGIVINGLVAAVVDHCGFTNIAGAFFVYADQYLDSWTDDLTLGTTNTAVFEDCTFFYDTDTISGRTLILLCDTGHGSRVCLRNSQLISTDPDLKFSPILMFHGNQDTVRGSRQQEVYGFTATTAGADDKLTDLRGGTTILATNEFIGEGMRSAFTAREEDANFPAWSTYTLTAPGYDKNLIYAWNNTSKGSPVTSLELYYETTDPPFFIENTDVFWSAKPGYTPLVYPHPLVTLQDGGGSEPEPEPTPAHSIGTFRATNLIIR